MIKLISFFYVDFVDFQLISFYYYLFFYFFICFVKNGIRDPDTDFFGDIFPPADR